MTQSEKVKQAVLFGVKTIAEITEFTKILRPNIRRILGEGAHAGIFKREGRGVYSLTTEQGEQLAYIEMGKAEEVLPRLVSEGKKFDMVFLDPAYYSEALVGRNRNTIKYEFMHTDAFAQVMKAVNGLMRSDDSHVYLMLSGARTAQKDMQKYLFAALESGMRYVSEGKYTKLFGNGAPVTNVRGDVAAAERIILLSRSGKVREGEIKDIELNIQAPRPKLSTSYSTQKSEILCDRLIMQSTYDGEIVGDFCAGSGIFGLCAVLKKRAVHMVESLEETINNFILPKFISI